MPDILMIVLRSAALVLLIMVLVRVTGIRPLARLTFFDFITTMVLAAMIAAIALDLVPNLAGGLSALAVWLILPALLYLLALKYKTVRDITQGREKIVINRGKVMEDQLMTARLTPEDLLSQLRGKNVFNFADVEFAILEPTGDLSVLLKKDKQPLTPKVAGLRVALEREPQTVILDGEILDNPLANMGLNRGWLHQELEKIGVSSANVFIAQVDSTGQLYVDLFDDKIKVAQPKAKALLYATLKKCQADCELYALGTQRPQARQTYAQCAELLTTTLQDLQPLLTK